MTFSINNIGKIRHAEVKLDGITLVVGNNNTGKTTVGRAINTFYTSLYRIDKKVDAQRNSQALRCLRNFYEKFRRPIGRGPIVDFVSLYIENHDDAGDNLREELVRRFYPRATLDDINNFIEELDVIRSLSKKSIRHQIISDAFDEVFSSQVLSLDRSDNGLVLGEIDGHKVSIEFSEQGVVHSSDINIQSRAILITSPDMLDRWGQFRYIGGGLQRSSFNAGLFSALTQDEDSDGDNSVENLLFAERYSRFITKIASIIGGHFNFDKNNILHFEELSDKDDDARNKHSFELSNVSEGLKSFGIIELMLRYRLFRDGDVLIFDEPEIRLHPAWQIKYAQILVELQKEFNLKILITTHSSNFMMALQMYARISNKNENISVYRIKAAEDNKRYSKVVSTDPLDWDEAYMSFITAAQEMNELHDAAYNDQD